MTMLQVEAHDPYGRFTTASVNITVLDVNDNIPVIETSKIYFSSIVGVMLLVCEILFVYHTISLCCNTLYPSNLGTSYIKINLEYICFGINAFAEELLFLRTGTLWGLSDCYSAFQERCTCKCSKQCCLDCLL